uniref:type II toxin-antitoxin system YafQ family toxin n=1 Tax=Butyrivibrio fibrisolvens TaxID=831 RepID=UPI0015E7EC35|nr:type II toxin-antitoxin system YafQ family toxin [Butyrivibrio fibrisolvens]
MKYTIKPTNKFQKDLKRVQKRGYDMNLLTDIVKKLANGEQLPRENRDHPLTGNYKGTRECHIQPDWLLVYEINEADLYLYLTRTGTHSDLFDK